MAIKMFLVIGVATFAAAFLGATIFAPHPPRVQTSNHDDRTFSSQAVTEQGRQQADRAPFDWDACTRSAQCIKAMRTFYTESAKPMYPMLVVK